MVLAVCRGVLKNPSDAEDAFQATFLVLYRKAVGVRSAGSLGGWLYRVADRIALRANAVSARRRRRFREETIMAAEAASPGEAGLDRETPPIIHAEIDRLPDRYRAPIALCYLEGLSYEQAAQRLGWPLGTVGSRISRAREPLRPRLARRGITASTAALAPLLSREATAAPPAWVESTTRAVLAIGAGQGIAAAGAIPAAVALSEHVLRRMFMIRLIPLTSFVVVLMTAGLVGWGTLGTEVRPETRNARPPAEAPRGEEPQKSPAGVGVIRGRVLTPDGWPVRETAILAGVSGEAWLVEPVARTDSDGRFQLDRAKLPNSVADGFPRDGWRHVELAAMAPGYGPAWSGDLGPNRSDVEMRLVPDDVPIRGRIIDTQGRPVPGATVKVGMVGRLSTGDPDALLRVGTIRQNQAKMAPFTAWGRKGDAWVEQKTIEVGPDGRFEVRGVGRDRVVSLSFGGPGLAQGGLFAITRPSPTRSGPRPRTSPPIYPLHGATFDYVAVPSKPIEGVVRSKATGRPVAGTSVSGHVPGTEESVWTKTDQDGRFRIDGLPKVPSYRIQVSPSPGQPFLLLTTTISDTEGLKPIPLTLDLLQGVVVRGRLVEKGTGKPVAGRDVDHIKLPSNTHPGQASQVPPFSPDGFQITVPPGPAVFTARAYGHDLPYTRARMPEAVRRMGIGDINDDAPVKILIAGSHACRYVDVPADVETMTLDLELTRGGTRKGRLVDPDGRPVAGVPAYGLNADWEVKTLDDETFEVIGLEPGRPQTVSFMHGGRRLARALAIEPGADSIEVRLAPCGSAIGRLIDPDGLPLAGAQVSLTLRDRRGEQIPLGMDFWPLDAAVTADEQGRFRVEGLSPDLIARLVACPRSQPGHFLVPEDARRAALETIDVEPGRTIDLGEIRMSRQPNP